MCVCGGVTYAPHDSKKQHVGNLLSHRTSICVSLEDGGATVGSAGVCLCVFV